MQLDPRSTTDLFEDAVSLFMLRRMSEGKQCLERALAISPDWLPARIGITQFLLFEGKTDEVYKKMDELAGVPGIVQQLISDPLYRFRWEIGLPPVYERRLEKLSLGDARVDSAEFYRAQGRPALDARHGDHGARTRILRFGPRGARAAATRRAGLRRSHTRTSDLRIQSSAAPRKHARTRTALERSVA